MVQKLVLRRVRLVTEPPEYDEFSALLEVSCQNVFSLAEITILLFS